MHDISTNIYHLHAHEGHGDITAHTKIKDIYLLGSINDFNNMMPAGANLTQAAAESKVTFHSEYIDFKSNGCFLN